MNDSPSKTNNSLKEQPLVSAIIPVYNGSQFIEELIISLKNQTYTNIEIIAIDNKSSDNSLEILNLLNSKNDNFRVITNEKNVGYANAINQGYEIAKGELILILSQDRTFELDWLTKTVSEIKFNPKVGCVIGKITSKDGKYVDYGIAMDIYGSTVVKRTPEKNNLFYQGGALLVRKSILDKIEVFDPEFFMYGDDIDLCWRIWLSGFEILLKEDAISYDNGKIIKSSIDGNELKIDFSDVNLYDVPLYVFYNAQAKARIRTLLKNYSLHNILKRIPIVITLVFLRGLFLSVHNRKSSYLFSVFKGLLWNIVNLRNTLKYRNQVQRSRVIDDNSIEKFMIKQSIEYKAIKLIIKSFFKK